MSEHAWAGALVSELAAVINSQLELGDVLQTVTDTGTRLTGAEFGAFFYNSVDEHGESYRLHVISGAAKEQFAAMPAPRITALFEPTFAGRSTVRIADLAATPTGAQLPRGHLPLRSYLATPVVAADGHVIGALLFGHPNPDVFAERAETIAHAVSAHAAVAITNAKLFAEQRAATAQAERNARDMAMLQRVTAKLARARTTEETLDALRAELAAPSNAIRSGVYLLEEGRLTGLTAGPAGADHRADRIAWGSGPGPSITEEATTTGRPVWISNRAEFEDRYPQRAALVPEVRSGIALPLVSEETRGALVLGWPHDREITGDDLRIWSVAADQLASTLERIRLVESEVSSRKRLRAYADAANTTSRTLQRSLLPQNLTVAENLNVAVRYQPGDAGVEVGGDWYDVIAVPDGKTVFVIGDVEGHSLAAAAVMGRISTSIHAYVAEGHDLDVVLARANRLVLEHDVLVTCALFAVDPSTGEVSMARAGHPSPVYQRDQFTAEAFIPGGPPLGIPEGTWPVERSHAQHGDRIVLFTDGLVERRDRDTEEQTRRLIKVVDAHEGEVDDLADVILDELGTGVSDDIALVVAEFGGEQTPRFSRIHITATREVSLARKFTRTHLARWDMDRCVETAELLVSEMVTNALVHATGTAVLELRPEGERLRISVRDQQPHGPRVTEPEDDATGGRGMQLVQMLADEWGVDPHGDGKTVWACLRIDA